MKVLHLTPSIPWPADTGGKIGIWNFIQADARHAETGILAFSDTPPDAITLGALGAVCRHVRWVKRPRTLDGVVGGARSMMGNVAMNMAKYRWPEYAAALAECIRTWSPDIVVAHHLHMADYLRNVKGPITIIREHNIDSDLMTRYAETIRNPALAAFARRQAEQIREMESRLCPAVSRCLLITRDDELALKDIAPSAQMSVVQGVIDVERYAPVEAPEQTTDPVVVTAGTFSFRPTGEGLVYFTDKVWPRIMKSFPTARLKVIGHCPPKLVRRVAGAGIEVLGRVEQVRPHLAGAHVFVVPLRVGSGMRMRILESLAWQIPTVSTGIGCQGIAVEDGRHLLVADAPEAMATAVGKLIKEKGYAQTLRREGRRLVEKHYSLAASAQLTGRIYARCLDPATVDQDAP